MQNYVFGKLVSSFFAGVIGFLSPVVLCTEKQGYCGSGEATEITQTINYDHKETTIIEIPSGVPYYNASVEENRCANIAGAVVLGYYDRFCEELIPNYKAYTKLGSRIIYKNKGIEVENVIDSLYDLMRTDKGQAGTTFDGFNSGMEAYIENHGYSYATRDVWNSDLSLYKDAVNSEKPVVIFASGFSFVSDLSEADSRDVITIDKYQDNHAMVGYGYRIDEYYNSDNKLIETRTYLSVMNGGAIDRSIKYLCLDGLTEINYAIEVTIS